MSEMIILKRREAISYSGFSHDPLTFLVLGPVLRQHIPGVESDAMVVGSEKGERSCIPTIPFKVMSPATQDLLFCPIFQMFYLFLTVSLCRPHL